MIIQPQDSKTERREGETKGTISRLLSPGQLHDKGRLFARITLEPGAKVALHTHHHDFEIIYILTGTGLAVDNDTKQQVSAGTLIFTNHGESHALENNGETVLEYLAMVLYN